MPPSSCKIRLDRRVFLPSASEINLLILDGISAGGRIVFSLPFVDPPAKTGVSGTGRWSTWVFRRRCTQAQWSERTKC